MSIAMDFSKNTKGLKELKSLENTLLDQMMESRKDSLQLINTVLNGIKNNNLLNSKPLQYKSKS